MTESNDPLVPPPLSDQPVTPPPPVPPQQYPSQQQQYPPPQYPAPPGAYPPPQGTQYGNTPYSQYGGGPYASGPYNNGPYASGPYGYSQGYFAQPQGTSGMAIASLILGICGFFCVTPFIGIGLGIGALSKIGKTGQPGKGMAIAGIILSTAWILLIVLSIATGHFHVGSGSGTGPTQPNGNLNGTPA